MEEMADERKDKEKEDRAKKLHDMFFSEPQSSEVRTPLL